MHALPGDTGLGARRQCRDNDSTWLRGAVLVLGYFDIQLLGEMNSEKIIKGM